MMIESFLYKPHASPAESVWHKAGYGISGRFLPAGARGRTGAAGAKGRAGAAGAERRAGPAGMSRRTGRARPAGSDRPAGAAGGNGADGPEKRGPAGPAGYPLNSIFASFCGQELVMPQKARLPLKTVIPDITQNIVLCGSDAMTLSPGYYAISYYISAVMKRHCSIKLTPVLNKRGQAAYTAHAQAAKRKELLVLSRHFLIRVPDSSTLFFAWQSAAKDAVINMDLSIEKLCRQ